MDENSKPLTWARLQRFNLEDVEHVLVLSSLLATLGKHAYQEDVAIGRSVLDWPGDHLSPATLARNARSKQAIAHFLAQWPEKFGDLVPLGVLRQWWLQGYDKAR